MFPFSCFIILLFVFGVTLEVYSIVEGGANPSSASVGIVFTAIGGIFFIFIAVSLWIYSRVLSESL